MDTIKDRSEGLKMMDNIRFNNFVNSKGYTLPNNFNYSIGMGELVRFKDTSKKKLNTDLWLKNIDNNIFVFGDWKTGDKYNYIDSDNQYNSYDKRAYNNQVLQQQKQKDIEAKKSLAVDLESYYLSLPNADSSHPYLVAKDIPNHEAIKQDDSKLVIPCIGINEPFDGKLQTIQTIANNGFKCFYRGANANASFLMLNKSTNDCFIFVEGFATAMSVLNAVNHLKTTVVKNNQTVELNNDISVVACFNCNNLKPIVSFFYGLYPEAELNIWADNDLNGVGIQKAKEVAAIVPDIYINPPPLTDEQKQQGLSDWNDYITKVRGDILS
ncbi:MAG: putative DNA primase/helicase [Francisella sp.]